MKSVKLTFKLLGLPSLDNTRVRIDLFTCKSGAFRPTTAALASTQDMIMPGALKHLSGMATPTANKFNPVYHKLVATKWCHINSQPASTAGTHPTTENNKYVSFFIKPRKGIVKNQQITVPATPQDEQIEVADGDYGPYNVPINQPLWCLISTDDEIASVGDRLQVQIQRECKWCDPIGGAHM